MTLSLPTPYNTYPHNLTIYKNSSLVSTHSLSTNYLEVSIQIQNEIGYLEILASENHFNTHSSKMIVITEGKN